MNRPCSVQGRFRKRGAVLRLKDWGWKAAFLICIIGMVTACSPKTPRRAESELPSADGEEEVFQADGSALQIDVERLPPDGKIQLGAFPLKGGMVCRARFSWEGTAASLAIFCESGEGDAFLRPLVKERAISFIIPEDGSYSLPIRNIGRGTAVGLKGTVELFYGGASMEG